MASLKKSQLEKLQELVKVHGTSGVAQMANVAGSTIRKIVRQGTEAGVAHTTYAALLHILSSPMPQPETAAPTPASSDFILPDAVLVKLAKESLRTGKPCADILLDGLTKH